MLWYEKLKINTKPNVFHEYTPMCSCVVCNVPNKLSECSANNIENILKRH